MTLTHVLIVGIPLYVMVGAVVGRLWNERSWRTRGVGRYSGGGERSISDAEDVHLSRGLALTVFWPLVGVGFLSLGAAVGLVAIFENIFVPVELRKKAKS